MYEFPSDPTDPRYRPTLGILVVLGCYSAYLQLTDQWTLTTFGAGLAVALLAGVALEYTVGRKDNA